MSLKEDWSVDIQGPTVDYPDDAIVFILDYKDGYRLVCEIESTGKTKIKLVSATEFHILQKESFPVKIQYIDEEE